MSDTLDPKTEITRAGIAELTGVSKTKIADIINDAEYRFPAPIRTISIGGGLVYSLANVQEWLQTNDPKKIVVKNKYYTPVRGRPKKPVKIADSDLPILKIGFPDKPKFNRTSTTTVVHLEEIDVCAPLNPHLTRHSHSGAGYVAHFSGNGLE